MWRAWISEGAIESLLDSAQIAHPKETGGILIGVLAGKRPWITHAVEIRPEHSNFSSYRLPSGSRHKVVTKLRLIDSRLGYLGDWHSHPLDLDASNVDERTIASLIISGDCQRPLLFIIRYTKNGYIIDASQWYTKNLRQLRIITAGPLTVS